MNTWFANIVASVLGAAVFSLLAATIQFVRYRTGELAGTWDQQVLDENGVVAKLDEVRCRHYGTHIKGTIRRIDPIDQQSKRWRFYGEVRHKLLFCIYFTTSAKKNPGSYGTIQLHILNNGLLEGFYVRIKETADDEMKLASELSRVRLKWVRRS